MAIMVPTYQLGRLGMALGYVGSVMVVCRLGALRATRRGFAAVGRMALTNYLMHSAIAVVSPCESAATRADQDNRHPPPSRPRNPARSRTCRSGPADTM